MFVIIKVDDETDFYRTSVVSCVFVRLFLLFYFILFSVFVFTSCNTRRPYCSAVSRGISSTKYVSKFFPKRAVRVLLKEKNNTL